MDINTLILEFFYSMGRVIWKDGQLLINIYKTLTSVPSRKRVEGVAMR